MKTRCVILADGANTLHAHAHAHTLQVNLASFPLQIIVCVCVCAQDNESSHGRSEKYKESTSNDMLYSVVLFSVRRTNIGFPLCASVVCVQYYYFCFLFFYITSLRFILIVFIYICVVCTSHLFRLPLELTDFFSPSNCMGTNSLTHQTH